MQKGKIAVFCALTELCIIISIAIATQFNGWLFGVFYNGVYGLVLSVGLPIYLLQKAGEDFSSVGVKKPGPKQYAVLAVFVALSVCGQLLPKRMAGERIPWEVLPVAVVPLIMTTFFEEFFFRGFVQTRLEKAFGCGVAIPASALLFALYHLGYPGFRTAADIALLGAVGLGFAIAYKLSGNNLFIVYFVNLPNALVTYTLKSGQFPEMTAFSSILAGVTIAAMALWIARCVRREKMPHSA